jgi:hypothetical protein
MQGLAGVFGRPHDAGMEETLSMLSLIVIGVSTLATAVVALQLPASQRLTVVLALVAGAGAGLASLGIVMVALPDTAEDTTFAWGFLASSVVGAIAVGLMLARMVRSERERDRDADRARDPRS